VRFSHKLSLTAAVDITLKKKERKKQDDKQADNRSFKVCLHRAV